MATWPRRAATLFLFNRRSPTADAAQQPGQLVAWTTNRA
jgi:hypothetical protein